MDGRDVPLVFNPLVLGEDTLVTLLGRLINPCLDRRTGPKLNELPCQVRGDGPAEGLGADSGRLMLESWRHRTTARFGR